MHGIRDRTVLPAEVMLFLWILPHMSSAETLWYKGYEKRPSWMEQGDSALLDDVSPAVDRIQQGCIFIRGIDDAWCTLLH